MYVAGSFGIGLVLGATVATGDLSRETLTPGQWGGSERIMVWAIAHHATIAVFHEGHGWNVCGDGAGEQWHLLYDGADTGTHYDILLKGQGVRERALAAKM